MAKNDGINMLFLVVGAFLIILTFGSSSGRLAIPTYDGTVNEFDIRIDRLDDTVGAVVGDPFSIDLYVQNTNDVSGRMIVQCSILSAEDHPWLQTVNVGRSAQTTTDIDNCVAQEEFTQTATVTLSGEDGNDPDELVELTVIVPNNPNQETYIYCAAYERCYTDGEPVISESFKLPIQIVDRANDDDDDDDNNDDDSITKKGEACAINSDCPNYLFGSIDCYQGYCVDSEDVPKDPKFTDIVVKKYIREHRIAISAIAIILLVIGGFGLGTKGRLF